MTAALICLALETAPNDIASVSASDGSATIHADGNSSGSRLDGHGGSGAVGRRALATASSAAWEHDRAAAIALALLLAIAQLSFTHIGVVMADNRFDVLVACLVLSLALVALVGTAAYRLHTALALAAAASICGVALVNALLGIRLLPRMGFRAFLRLGGDHKRRSLYSNRRPPNSQPSDGRARGLCPSLGSLQRLPPPPRCCHGLERCAIRRRFHSGALLSPFHTGPCFVVPLTAARCLPSPPRKADGPASSSRRYNAVLVLYSALKLDLFCCCLAWLYWSAFWALSGGTARFGACVASLGATTIYALIAYAAASLPTFPTPLLLLLPVGLSAAVALGVSGLAAADEALPADAPFIERPYLLALSAASLLVRLSHASTS